MKQITWSLITVVVLALLSFRFEPFAWAQQPSLSSPPTPTVSDLHKNLASRRSQVFPSNADFETGDLTSWSLNGAPGVWTVTSADKHAGSYSAHVLLTDATAYTVSTLTSDLYSIIGNQATSLVFWARVPQVVNGGKLVVQTEWYNLARVQLGSSGQTIRNAPVPSWTKYQIPIVLPINAALMYVYLAALVYPGDTIEAYVDDLSSSAAGDPLLFLPLVSR